MKRRMKWLLIATAVIGLPIAAWANLSSVGIVNGVPTTGTGDASTIDALMADGGQATVGAKADAVCATPTGTCTLIALIKYLNNAAIAALPSGTNIIGKFGIDQTTPGTTNAVQPIPGTAGGLSAYFVQPAASDNHVVIKAGAGQVYHISVTNISAVVNYLRLYNATTGFNGCNSATNLVGQWAIPANTSGGGFTVNFLHGVAFATGISICVTSGYATTDTTNATASAMSVNVGYK